jgi:transcriptional regulator GlxA family with amidase domain
MRKGVNRSSDPNSMDQRVRAVIALMNASLNRKLTVCEMAMAVGLSASHLRRLFKAQTGKPVAVYLKDIRLQHSRELLETTFLSIKQIADRVGQSTNHFVTDFKKMYGVTPARFATRYCRTDKSSDALKSVNE